MDKGKRTYLTQEESARLDRFPGLSREELDAANDLFLHKILYKREKEGRRVWTSCCHREELVPWLTREETPELHDIKYEGHGTRVTCPWCQRSAELRAKGRTCGRTTAYDEEQVVFLKAADGGIYAQAYWLNKNYRERPADYPHYCLSFAYWFEPGRAQMFWYQPYTEQYYVEEERGKLSSRKNVKEPFPRSGCYNGHDSYKVIGLEELDKSFARYCRYRMWRNQDAPGAVRFDDLIRFLTVAAIYPMQLEMLNKAGQKTLINDLMWEGKKNAKFFRWEETDPRKAFGMSGQELKRYLAMGDALYVLETRKLLGCSFEQAMDWFSDPLNGVDNMYELRKLIDGCKKYGVDINEARKYWCRFAGVRCYGGIFGLYQVFKLWEDYLTNARAAGFDLTQRNILMPRDLHAAHDNAQAIVQAKREAADKAKKEEQDRLAREREKEINQRYAFETEHYFIRAPHSGEEIIQEGRKLQHCVGGYAQRHAVGTATILLLRDKSAPDTPLCTIQVDGKHLVQIHGFKNDTEKGAVKPELRFAEIYEPWFAWISAGSPRKKDGTPAVPRKKARKTA